MYTPSAFEGSREQALQLVREHPFATLITPGANGLELSHLPLLLEDDGRQLTLTGHMARANSHWRSLESAESTAVFLGPHGYISPAWYAEPSVHVPTWNYIAVHARGSAILLSEEASRAALLGQAHHFEAPPPQGWQLALPPQRFEAMRAAIVFFQIRIGHIECKRKLSQNRAMADVRSLTGHLRDQATTDALQMADLIESANAAR